MKLRYSIMTVLTLTLIMSSIGCQKKVQEEPKVIFQDQTFQALFDSMRYRESSDYIVPILPTQSQLDQMTALYLCFSPGEECSLKDLEKFPNLRGLLICNASESVIQQVSEQEQLKALNILVHDPVDMSPIGTMHNIKAMEINAPGEDAGKFDWSFIKDMKQLETLEIEDIKLNDLDFLKSLPNLERIFIQDVEIGDTRALETLSNLKYLGIWDSNSDYTDVLKKMNHLEQLSIGNVEITDWNFLKDMRDLNWLSIRNMRDVKLPNWFLPENYPNLSMLDVDDNILNGNRELLNQIMPILDERKEEKKPVPQLSDQRLDFPVLLEVMHPVETYDN